MVSPLIAAANLELGRAAPVIKCGSRRRAQRTMLEPILIVGIVIAITAWYVQHKWRRRARALAAMRERDTAVLDVLARRYASGEIDRDEYLQKRSDILSFSGIPQDRV